MANNDIIFRVPDVTRTIMGTLGVDSGTMAIATEGQLQWADALMWGADSNYDCNTVAAVSRTGFGDGGYDLLELTDDDGCTIGLEVVFIIPEADRVGSINADLYAETFTSLLLVGHPETDTRAEVVTQLHVTSHSKLLEVGDPCYGKASETVRLEPGDYTIVVYEADMADWGTRVARLGAYRDDE